MVAQTAKSSSHSTNFDVFGIILEASKKLCTWGTRSSWLNYALRDDEAVYWVIIGQQWLVLGGTESV